MPPGKPHPSFASGCFWLLLEIACGCSRVEYKGPTWPPTAVASPASPPGKSKKGGKQQGSPKKSSAGDDFRPLPDTPSTGGEATLPLSACQPGATYSFRVVASRPDGSGAASTNEEPAVTILSTLPDPLA